MPKKLTREEFINRARSIHGNRYDYNLVKYRGINKDVIIICALHGVFTQTPHVHYYTNGCPKCSARYVDTDSFVAKAKQIHGTLYDYSLVKYINNYTPVQIICPTHGVFEQLPNSHICSRHGCPKCQPESVGVCVIRDYLEQQDLSYTQEYTFEGCRDKKPLPFDFKVNIEGVVYLIEFDGRQHYQPVNSWDGISGLRYTQLHDTMKTLYCQNNDIPLLRIPYWRQHEIPKLLNNFLPKLDIRWV